MQPLKLRFYFISYLIRAKNRVAETDLIRYVLAFPGPPLAWGAGKVLNCINVLKSWESLPNVNPTDQYNMEHRGGWGVRIPAVIAVGKIVEYLGGIGPWPPFWLNVLRIFTPLRDPSYAPG